MHAIASTPSRSIVLDLTTTNTNVASTSSQQEESASIKSSKRKSAESTFGFRKNLAQCTPKHKVEAAKVMSEVLLASNRFSPDVVETLSPHIHNWVSHIEDLSANPSSKTPREIKEASVRTEFLNPVIKNLISVFTNEYTDALKKREILTYFKDCGYSLTEVNGQLNEANQITDYAWTKAFMDVNLYGVGMTHFKTLSTNSKVTRQYDENEYIAARDFIKREKVTQGHSYGTHIVMDSQGIPQEIPSWIRCMTIEQAYDVYCKERIESKCKPLSDKNFRTLITTLAPRTEEMLCALDPSYTKNCLENAQSLRDLIGVICFNKTDLKTSLLQKVNEVVQFYTKELTNHFSEDSSCKWHNYGHLLDYLNDSVRNNPFDGTNEEEESFCDSCEMMTLLINLVCKAIPDMEFSQTPPGVEGIGGADPIVFDVESAEKLELAVNEIKRKFESYWGHKVRIHIKNLKRFQRIIAFSMHVSRFLWHRFELWPKQAYSRIQLII